MRAPILSSLSLLALLTSGIAAASTLGTLGIKIPKIELCGDNIDNDDDGLKDEGCQAVAVAGPLQGIEPPLEEIVDGSDADTGVHPGWPYLTTAGGRGLLITHDRDDSAGTDAGLVHMVPGDELRGGTTAEAITLQGAGAGHRLGSASASSEAVSTLDDDWLMIGASGGNRAYLITAEPTADGSISGAASATLYGPTGRGIGSVLAAAGDVDGDGYGDALVGAPLTSSSNGAAHLLFGPLGSTSSIPSVSHTFSGNSAEQAGSTLAGAGDMDGDGLDDLAVGARAAESNRGRVYLFLGDTGFGVGSTSTSSADATYRGEAAGDLAGSAIAGIGDMNGDGYDDLAVSSPYADWGGTSSGSVYLLYGDGSLSGGSLGAADGILDGELAGDYLGTSLAGGDIDGDARADLAIGATGRDTGGSSAGALYLVLEAPYGITTLSSVGNEVYGTSAYGMMGSSAAVVDLDGDGLADTAVASRPDDTVTVIYAGGLLGF